MNEIYVVIETVRVGGVDKLLHAFTQEEKAETFCINYLYGKSTLEDRTYNKIEKSDYCYQKEYSLFTAEYGEIELKIKKVNLD